MGASDLATDAVQLLREVATCASIPDAVFGDLFLDTGRDLAQARSPWPRNSPISRGFLVQNLFGLTTSLVSQAPGPPPVIQHQQAFWAPRLGLGAPLELEQDLGRQTLCVLFVAAACALDDQVSRSLLEWEVGNVPNTWLK